MYRLNVGRPTSFIAISGRPRDYLLARLAECEVCARVLNKLKSTAENVCCAKKRITR